MGGKELWGGGGTKAKDGGEISVGGDSRREPQTEPIRQKKKPKKPLTVWRLRAVGKGAPKIWGGTGRARGQKKKTRHR